MPPGAKTHDTPDRGLDLAMLMTDTPPADWTEGRCPASVLYDDGMCGKRAAIGNLCRFHHVIATHRALITSARIGGR